MDLLPTNCVGDWVCPNNTSPGYPGFAYRPEPKHCYKNLTTFYQACAFDYLFFQNWRHRSVAGQQSWINPTEPVDTVDENTSCICYFGGDPKPQLTYALCASHLDLDRKEGHFLRICWEANGSVYPALLIPGYIDKEATINIAIFTAFLDTDIPYTLLGFHPDFSMTALPATSFQHAQRCLDATKGTGLHKVRVENVHLLQDQILA